MSSPTTIHLHGDDGGPATTAIRLIQWLTFLYTEPNRGSPELPTLSGTARVRVIVRETQAVVAFNAKLTHDPITHAPSAGISTTIMWDGGTPFIPAEIEEIRSWAGEVLRFVSERVIDRSGPTPLVSKRTLQ